MQYIHQEKQALEHKHYNMHKKKQMRNVKFHNTGNPIGTSRQDPDTSHLLERQRVAHQQEAHQALAQQQAQHQQEASQLINAFREESMRLSAEILRLSHLSRTVKANEKSARDTEMQATVKRQAEELEELKQKIKQSKKS
jgi:hypothetical protein